MSLVHNVIKVGDRVHLTAKETGSFLTGTVTDFLVNVAHVSLRVKVDDIEAYPSYVRGETIVTCNCSTEIEIINKASCN